MADVISEGLYGERGDRDLPRRGAQWKCPWGSWTSALQRVSAGRRLQLEEPEAAPGACASSAPYKPRFSFGSLESGGEARSEALLRTVPELLEHPALAPPPETAPPLGGVV